MNFENAEKEAIKMVESGVRISDSHRLIEIHKVLIGDKPDKWYCANCSGKMQAVFYDLRLKYFKNSTSKSTKMAKTQYRFTAASKKSGVNTIILNDGERTERITPESLTDAKAKRILSNPRFAHNIERIDGAEITEDEIERISDSETDSETAAPKKSAKKAKVKTGDSKKAKTLKATGAKTPETGSGIIADKTGEATGAGAGAGE